MKNSIFKSYTRKILRSEAFISVIIVFVLALGIIGTSYALYMDVDKDTDYQLVESGDLKVSFSGSDTITLNALPQEDENAINLSDNIFTFNIYNAGTYIADYKIKLVATTGSGYVSSEYINYQLCKGACIEDTPINTLSNITDSIVHTDIIKTNDPGHDYILRLWVNNEYPGTTEQSLQVKVVVEATNRSVSNLADTIMNDTRIVKNTNSINITKIETNEVGMYSAEDDYGTSWYFRGAQRYNYVNFAGFTWRIVRINGDGSIRLILNGGLDKVINENETEATYKNAKLFALDNDGLVPFKKTPYTDNAYIGYMFGNITNNSSLYDNAHKNELNSTIKTYIDTFYEEYISDYQNYLADTLFCGDKSLAANGIGGVATQRGYGTNKTYYAAIGRLFYVSGTNSISVATPTLECAKGATNTYSRYTSESSKTTKGVAVNSDLNYPIGLLSADELVLAGAFPYEVNQIFYLNDSFNNGNGPLSSSWWTMTPSSFSSSSDMPGVFFGTLSQHSVHTGGSVNMTTNCVRPVINLKSTVIFKSGNGTEETPYVIN